MPRKAERDPFPLRGKLHELTRTFSDPDAKVGKTIRMTAHQGAKSVRVAYLYAPKSKTLIGIKVIHRLVREIQVTPITTNKPEGMKTHLEKAFGLI